MSETSYTPGTWFGIVGDHATVLLPPTEKARAGAIWALVDGGAGFDEVLDALVADGLRSLPGFVLITTADDTTRVVVRGSAKARFETIEGDVDVDGSGSATWTERSLSGVSRCTVDLGEGAGAGVASYVVTAGLVRVGGITVPPAEAAASSSPAVAVPPVEYGDETPQALADEPVDIAAPRRDEPVAPALSLVPPVPIEARKEYEPEAPLVGGDPLTDPFPGGEGAAPPVVPPLPPFPAPPAAPGFPPPPPPAGAGGAAAAPPPPPPAFAPPTDHDGHTRAGAPMSEDGFGASASGPAMTSYPVARLEFSSGQHVDVDRVVVVGRAPEAGRFSHSEQPLLVTVPSPHQEISSTHLEVRPGTGVDHGAAVATDLGSTNGTVLVQPGLGPEELRPGVPVQLMPGAVIDLGDGLQIRVLNP